MSTQFVVVPRLTAMQFDGTNAAEIASAMGATATGDTIVHAQWGEYPLTADGWIVWGFFGPTGLNLTTAEYNAQYTQVGP
jgi:hypothetical protein